MIASGWEIASHGLKWVEHKDMPEEEERAQIAQAIQLHTEVVGTPPRGWYTGRCSNNTVRLVAETGQFAYVADSYADDLPYWSRFGETDQLIVPYTMDCNDMRFAIQAGFTTGDQFESYLKDSFDYLYAEGEAGQPKMLSIGLHCRLIGRPGRAAALKRAIEHFKSHEAFGSPRGWKLPNIGPSITPRRSAFAPLIWTVKASHRLSAGSLSTARGSPRRPMRSSWGRRMTRRRGCIRRYAEYSALPRRNSGLPC